MSKGDLTRQHIIERAAIVFNQKGFAGTSLQDIMDATGLRKGGIYNHFSSKDEIALAAFDYSYSILNSYFTQKLEGVESPIERLITFIKSFSIYKEYSLMEGGCPILNTAIEHTDGNEDLNRALKQKAQKGLNVMIKIVSRRLEKAIEAGEARADTDVEQFASLVIASLEGSVMLSRINEDFSHLERVIDHLIDTIEREIRL